MCFPIEGGRQIHANLMFIHTDASFLEHEKYAKTILLIIKMVILYFFFPAREDISLKKKEYESRGQDVGQKTIREKETHEWHKSQKIIWIMKHSNKLSTIKELKTPRKHRHLNSHNHHGYFSYTILLLLFELLHKLEYHNNKINDNILLYLQSLIQTSKTPIFSFGLGIRIYIFMLISCFTMARVASYSLKKKLTSL